MWPLVHVEGSPHAMPSAMAVVEAHAPQWCARQGVQGQAVRALWEDCRVQRYVPLHAGKCGALPACAQQLSAVCQLSCSSVGEVVTWAQSLLTS